MLNYTISTRGKNNCRTAKLQLVYTNYVLIIFATSSDDA